MKIVYSIILILFSLISFSQEVTVNGTVKDANGATIPGVNVLVKRTNNGAVTDFDGNYTLEKVAIGDTILFSYLGFVSQTITVTNQAKHDIVLTEDNQALDEVVVVGYGTQKKKELTGAVSVVSSKIIDALKPVRIEQALQGQVAGVNIVTQSGSPGSASTINIRGISTNGDNRPLILVDGNVIEDLSVINPGDIQNVTVLKDATAGIYGVRAANGVILITTKTGRKESPLQFEYAVYGGFQQTTRELPVLNATEYALLRNEAAAANGEGLPFVDVAGLGRGTDWQKEVFENALIMNHNFSASGGTKKSTYSFGASLLTQDGIVGGGKSNFTRYNSRINYGLEIIKDLNLKANLIYTGSKRKTLPENGLGSVLFNALNIGPNLTPTQSDGSFTRALNYPIEVVNPLAQIAATNNLTKVDKVSGVFGLNYKFLTNFTAEANYQWNYSEVLGNSFFPITDFGNVGANTVFDRDVNRVVENIDFFRDYTFDAFLNYEKLFSERHKLKATLGTSVFRTTGDQYSRTGDDLLATSLANASVDDAATITDNFQARSNRIFDARLLSYFARLQYNYKEKYLLSGLARRDGSTSFGPKNKFGYFGAGSLGWVVSEEAFLSNIEAISFLKIRSSYGILGNDRIPGFRFASLLNGEATYVIDNQLVLGSAIGPIANPEIKWEEQKAFDIGMDLRLFNNKIDITVDYFSKNTEGLLLEVQASRILGTSAPGAFNPIVNAGSVKNEGFEFQIAYRDQINDHLKFNISYNIATLTNEVTEVNNGVDFVEGGNFGIGQEPPSRFVAGQPIGVFYGYQTNGVFQNQAEVDAHPSQIALGANAQPGDLRFVDLNNDDVINDEDRTYIGNPIPSATMGLNLGIDYKKFDFQTYLYASVGNDIVRNYDRNDPITNTTIYILDRWTGTGSTNTDPRVTNGATSNNVFSDYFIEDGSFLRAQNMQLGYTFDGEKIKNNGIKNLRVYVSVSNLFTLTKYRGYDPTATSGGATADNPLVTNPVGAGIDNGVYPTPRTFLIGTNIKF